MSKLAEMSNEQKSQWLAEKLEPLKSLGKPHQFATANYWTASTHADLHLNGCRAK